MARIVKIFKTIRTNWKKSTFLALAVAYGTNYTIEHFQTHELMRTYCLEAKKFGDQVIPDGSEPKKITVILNPTANRRKAAKHFEKYCAPILHLAGFCVDILQTESEGHARKLIENLKNTDAIIIAGGDGTISEVITGLLRRADDDRRTQPCPVGILPLGQTNSLGKVLFPGGETLGTVKTLADASLAIVKENTKLVDVMKIEIIQRDPKNPDTDSKNQNSREENQISQNQKITEKENPKIEEIGNQSQDLKNQENDTNIGTENSKISTENSSTENFKILSENSKIGTDHPGTENTKISSENPKILSENSKISSENPKISSENSKILSDNSKISSENSKISLENSKIEGKPIYALASLEWGAFRDAYASQDKYWYWGSLRKYATYIFNGYKSNLAWECCAEINYLEPCDGCSNCFIPEKSNQNSRWWSRLWSKPKMIEKDYSKIKNERCALQHKQEFRTTDLELKTANILNLNEPKIQINIGPNETKYLDFVQQGFKTLKGEDRHFEQKISARQIEILPKNLSSEKEIWFSIDKEAYEAMPVRITLLPRVLKVFCKSETS